MARWTGPYLHQKGYVLHRGSENWAAMRGRVKRNPLSNGIAGILARFGRIVDPYARVKTPKKPHHWRTTRKKHLLMAATVVSLGVALKDRANAAATSPLGATPQSHKVRRHTVTRYQRGCAATNQGHLFAQPSLYPSSWQRSGAVRCDSPCHGDGDFVWAEVILTHMRFRCIVMAKVLELKNKR
jgi:hypothetical protein